MLIFTSRFAFATLNFESVESLDKFAASFKALFVVGSSDQQTTPFPASIHKSIIKLTGETKPLKNPYEDSFKTSTIFAKFEKLQKTKTKVEGGLQRQAGQGTSKAREPKKLKIVETPIIAELSKKYEEKGKMMKALVNEECYFKPKDNLSNYLGASFINSSKFTSNCVISIRLPRLCRLNGVLQTISSRECSKEEEERE